MWTSEDKVWDPIVRFEEITKRKGAYRLPRIRGEIPLLDVDFHGEEFIK
ncbi:hypothetical protein NC652_023321 [Populus alba x Populus x berolinensis]|nr:hypothetical protein NC652_023321 [Populus alba x Populus x berolinensis]